jgi:hypothetical protein
MSKIRLTNITNIKELARNLSSLLSDITMKDNMRSFTYEGTLAANGETKIRNLLTILPNSYIIRYQSGDALITSSTTAWTDDFIYMENHHATNIATVKITFWKE